MTYESAQVVEQESTRSVAGLRVGRVLASTSAVVLSLTSVNACTFDTSEATCSGDQIAVQPGVNSGGGYCVDRQPGDKDCPDGERLRRVMNPPREDCIIDEVGHEYDGLDSTNGAPNPYTLNTGSWQPGDNAFQVGLRGRIAASDSGCVYFQGGNYRTDVIWPADYVVLAEEGEPFKVLNQDGEVAAVEGQRYLVGGAPLPKTQRSLTCSVNNQEQPFTIMEDLP